MLNEIMKFYGFDSRKQFADKIGISPQNAYTWFKRGIFDAEAIFASCPEISGDWLLSGEGEIRRCVSQTINGGSHNANVAGNLTSGLDKESFELFKEQQKIAAKAQEQSDRLIAIIENMTTKQNGNE